MSLLNILNIAGSAMKAQSQKINVSASNIANAESFIYENGSFHPYIAKKVIFSLDPINNLKIGGVKVSKIIDDSSPMKMTYDPSNPMSDAKGYILTSNVNPITEIVNSIASARSYQSNIEILKTVKSMITKTLTIGE